MKPYKPQIVEKPAMRPVVLVPEKEPVREVRIPVPMALRCVMCVESAAVMYKGTTYCQTCYEKAVNSGR